MRRTTLLLAAALLLCTGAGLPGSLEGDWVLVEQQYGSGGRNIYADDLPVRLSVRLGAGDPVVTLEAGDHVPAPWPAWIGPSGPVEIRLEKRTIDPASGTLRARFTMVSPEDPGFTFQVDEEYRLDPADGSLAGTMTVSFFRDGEPRGSFVLTTRFERER